jgi:hypothetical protein
MSESNLKCPGCGVAVRPNAVFCYKCGRPLIIDKPSPKTEESIQLDEPEIETAPKTVAATVASDWFAPNIAPEMPTETVPIENNNSSTKSGIEKVEEIVLKQSSTKHSEQTAVLPEIVEEDDEPTVITARLQPTVKEVEKEERPDLAETVASLKLPEEIPEIAVQTEEIPEVAVQTETIGKIDEVSQETEQITETEEKTKSQAPVIERKTAAKFRSQKRPTEFVWQERDSDPTWGFILVTLLLAGLTVAAFFLSRMFK